jgi:hypothetical protein
MRRPFLLIAVCCLLATASPLPAATGRVVKVLPHYLDQDGRRARSPSLYDRDAYQAYLRRHPDKRSGFTFDIQWKTRGGIYSPLKLQVELIGTAKGNLPSHKILEKEIKPGGWFSHWTSLALSGEEYLEFGDYIAWRVRLWEGDRLLSEQRSFLWRTE